MRKNYSWKLPRTPLDLGPRTAIMGILNLTPDSFSDGGAYNSPEAAVERALEIESAGADVLDIGGQSTRPGSSPVTEREELSRVIPQLERIASKIKIPISIDTYYAEVARQAVRAGAQIINDISGFRLDPKMSRVAGEAGAGVILMHSRGKRETLHHHTIDDEPERIRSELKQTVEAALGAGVPPEAIVVDPGIGFSKDRQTSLKVLKRLDLFSTLGYPLLVGPSRKSFIKADISLPDAPEWATAAAVALAVHGGAHLIRVHDVLRMGIVVNVADSVILA